MGRIERQRIVIPYEPRPKFIPFHERSQRWAVLVAHRRCGKTVACINDLVKRAITCPKPDGRYFYLAPYHAQAKDVAWDYLLRYTAPIPGREANISELRVDLPNGARVRLYGAENAERLRGLYFDGGVIDEPADIDPRVFPEIIRPALSDRKGWCTWIGTPKGKNAFWDLWRDAQADPDFYRLMLKASETDYVDSAELEQARKSMTPDQYAQEYECSFDAAIQGAYYAKLLAEAEQDKRIARVPYDPAARVTTAWDLGYGDSTAIWFCQTVGHEVRLIDYYEASGEALGHYAKVLKDKPYVYGEHLLPHDAEATELGTGKTRVETLAGLGIAGTVVPAQSVEDGINAVRLLLPKCWFDADKCARGLDALRQYRTEFDDKRKVFRNKPLHDWTSHCADAFRMLALGLREAPKPRKRAISQGGWLG